MYLLCNCRRQLVQQVEDEYQQGRYSVVIDVVCGELAEDGGCDFADEEQRTLHCTMLLHALAATADYKVGALAATADYPIKNQGHFLGALGSHLVARCRAKVASRWH